MRRHLKYKVADMTGNNRKGDRMAEVKWVVEGRRFRNEEEYQAALRDKEHIALMTDGLKLDNPADIEKLYMELQKGKYTFESIVGRQFDDIFMSCIIR